MAPGLTKLSATASPVSEQPGMLSGVRATDESIGRARLEVGVVVIGRNEGQRLVDCLASLKPFIERTVYVDSGSTDGSVEMARQCGAQVVALDLSVPFTAARARNAGFKAAEKLWPNLAFMQFVDGDCEIDKNWIGTAKAFLEQNKRAVIAFGYRRERFPERSIYNALCDREWNGPPGEVNECGGDILVRVGAFGEAGGYLDSLIAGEEPELCIRLRERGYTIWRLDAEMTRHDANILHLRQWWRRSVRAGHAFAEVSFIHAHSSMTTWRRSVVRSLFWAGALPIFALVGGLIINPAISDFLILYPFQLTRGALREGASNPASWRNSFFDMLGKFPELQGVMTFCVNHLRGRRQTLIEYK